MHGLSLATRAGSFALQLVLFFCVILNFHGFVQNELFDIRYRIQSIKILTRFDTLAFKLAGIVFIILSSHILVFNFETRVMSSFAAETLENEGDDFANNLVEVSSNSVGLQVGLNYIAENPTNFDQTQLSIQFISASDTAINEIDKQMFSERDLNTYSNLIHDISKRSDTMMVANIDLPLLEITAPTRPTIESAGVVNFIISTNAMSNPGILRVRYDPSEVDDDFLNQNAPLSQEAPISRAVRFSGSTGDFKGTLRVRIHDDMVAEMKGEIQVTLLADNASPATYRIGMDGTETAMADILDDESFPVLTISGGPKVIESDVEGSPAVAMFTVHSRAIPMSGTINVKYTAVGASFINDSGSEMMSSLMFEKNMVDGEFQARLPITILSDMIAEPNGRVTVTLNNETSITNYLVGNPRSASVLVFDDETHRPLLSVAGPSGPVFENERAIFTISASEDPIRTLEVNYILEEINGDFVESSNEGRKMTPTLKFTPDDNGKYTATFAVELNDDDDAEVRNNIYITLLEEDASKVYKTYSINFGATSNSAIATVLDNDAPELSIVAGTGVEEGDDVNAEFKVIANLMPSTGLLVRFKPTSESFLAAGESGEVTQVSSALNFQKVNDQYVATLPIRIHNDDVVELGGTLSVELVDDNPSSRTYSLAPAPKTSAVVNVSDDDSPKLKISDAYVNEGDFSRQVQISITMEPASSEVVSVKWSTGKPRDSARAGEDYIEVSGETVSFNPGETVKMVTLEIVNDNEVERMELLSVFLHEPSGGLAAIDPTMDTAEVTIDYDDYEISISDPSPILEGNSGVKNLNFNVTLFPVARDIITVTPVARINSKNSADENDFSIETTEVTFFLGGSSVMISVEIQGDEIAETDESLVIELTNPRSSDSNVSFKNKSATGIILNDDTGFSVADAKGIEGDTGDSREIEFVVTIDPVVAVTTSVMVSTALQEGSNKASSEDIKSISNLRVNFPPNTSRSRFKVTIVGDVSSEFDETFSVMLSNPTTNLEIVRGIATGTIVNDDSGVLLMDTEIIEGDPSETTQMEFTVQMYPPLARGQTAEMNWRVKNVSTDNESTNIAVAGKDYMVGSDNQISFKSGQQTAKIAIEIVNDEIVERDKVLAVEIFNIPDDVGNIRDTAIGTIRDNDIAGISIHDTMQYEGNSGTSEMNFLVTLDVESEIPITVNWETLPDGGTAIENDDFIPGAGKITFNAGETSKMIGVLIKGDEEPEANDELAVLLSNPTPQEKSILINDRAIGVILRDDTINGLPEVSITAKESIVTKGSPVTFVLTVFPPTLTEFELDVEYMAEEVEFFATEDFLLWRADKIFKFSAENNEMTFKTYDTPDSNSEVRLIVTLFKTEQYDAPEGRNMAEVVLRRDDTMVIPTDEPRISVASSVVTSILNSPHLSNPNTEQQAEFLSAKPIISIHATKSFIEEGEVVEFYLTANQTAESAVATVNLEINQVGDFFHQAQDQLSLQLNGLATRPISIQTINDDYAEEDGNVTINIINDETYEIAENAGQASVTISDAEDRNAREYQLTSLTQRFLPSLIEEVGKQNAEVLSLRAQQMRIDNGRPHLNFGGQESIQGILSVSGDALNDDSISMRNFLGESSFTMPVLSGGSVATPTNLWGIGNFQELSSNSLDNTEDWSADLFTGHLGIDTKINSDTLTGLSYSVTEADVEIETNVDEMIDFTLNTTSINPFISWSSANGETNLHAMVGYGFGELGINQLKYEFAQLKNRSIALVLSGSSQLYSSTSILNGHSQLNVYGESWLEHQSIYGQDGLLENLNIDAYNFKIRTEGSHLIEFQDGATLNPYFTVGYRKFDELQLNQSGIELMGDINYVEPIGISLSASGGMLLSDDHAITASSLEGTLNFDFGNDNLGLMLEVTPTWGQATNRFIDATRNNVNFESSKKTNRYTNGIHLDSNVGYGIELNDKSRMIFSSGFKLDNMADGELKLGTDLTSGKNFSVGVNVLTAIGSGSNDRNKVRLSGQMNW